MKLKLVWVGLGAFTLLALLLIFLNEDRETTFFQDGRAPQWKVTPVVVSYSADVAKAWERQVKEAVASINDEVDCTVLDTSGAPAQVRILTPMDDSPCANLGQEIDGNTGAITHVCNKGTVDIVVWSLVDARQAFLALKHELAHALGLDHDPGGLMAPVLPEAAWKGPPDVPGSILSRKDVLALRDRYCK